MCYTIVQQDKQNNYNWVILHLINAETISGSQQAGLYRQFNKVYKYTGRSVVAIAPEQSYHPSLAAIRCIYF